MAGISDVNLGREGSGYAQVIPQNTVPQQLLGQLTAFNQGEFYRKRQQQQIYDKALADSMIGIGKDGWDVDIQRKAVGDIDAIRKRHTEYMSQGKNPSDYRNFEAYSDINSMLSEAKANTLMSKAQKSLYDKYKFELESHPEKYNRPEAEKLLEKYKGASISERAKMSLGLPIVPLDILKYVGEKSKAIGYNENVREVVDPVTGLSTIDKSKKWAPESIQRATDILMQSQNPEDLQFKQQAATQASKRPEYFAQYWAMNMAGANRNPAAIKERLKKMTPEEIALNAQKGAMLYNFQIAEDKSYAHNIEGSMDNNKSASQKRRESFTFTPTLGSPIATAVPSTTATIKELIFGKPENPYIALNYDKTAADNNPLYLNSGEQVNPLGFEKTKDGWHLIGRKVEKVADGAGGFKTIEKQTTIPFSNKEDVARMAAYVGYEDVVDFENMLNKQAAKVSKTPAKSAPNTQKGAIDLSKFDKTK